MISELNRQFGIDDRVVFEQRQGIIVVRIAIASALAEISLQGAQVLSYRPAGQDSVLWLSDAARFEVGQAIRGGVPVCWPWFGEHPGATTGAPDSETAGFPQHGFARTSVWQVLGVSVLDEEAVLQFELPMHGAALLANEQGYLTEEIRRLNLKLEVRVGSTLTMKLITTNYGVNPVTLTQALHSYFQVGNIADTEILGLESHDYYDKTRDMRRFQSNGKLSIDQEVDRIYLNPPPCVSIEDRGLNRVIDVSSPSSKSCVVWNPWAQKAQSMSDFPDEGFQSMICVESTHARDDARIVEPGQALELVQHIAVRK